MKIVINRCFGGFSINEELAKKYGFNDNFDRRTNEKFINLIESGADFSSDCSKLVVVEIPNEATDYIINNYDGIEEIIYVIDGKIHTI